MKLDRKLNIVLEVERDAGGSIHVHSQPVSREIYEAHFELISQSIYGLYTKGFTPPACTRMVHDKLKQLIKENPEYKNAEQTLLAEIWRLTNVLVPSERGWETVPFFEAMSRPELLTPDDVAEVKNFVCFFMGASWAHGKSERSGMYSMVEACGAQTTSSDVTEYKTSLPILTATGSSGETVSRSLIPS